MYLFLPFIKINQAYLQIKRIGGSFQILMTVKKHHIKDHELKNQHSHIILWKENQIKENTMKPLQIVFLGTNGVGKTSTIRRFLYGTFQEKTEKTLAQSYNETVFLPSKLIWRWFYDVSILLDI